MVIVTILFIGVISGDGAYIMPMTVSASIQYNSIATTFMDSPTATNAILLVNQSIINNKIIPLFVKTNILCQNTIDVDPGSSAFDNNSIKCIEELLKKCEPYEFYLLYGLGSMILSIQGKENSLCSISLVHEIEMGEKRYNCLIPLDKVANWSSWKNSNGLNAVDDILPFCSSLNR